MPDSIQKVLCMFAQEIRRILGEKLRKIIIYGSYTRGDFDEDSDVDIMILTSLDGNEIRVVDFGDERCVTKE